MRGDLVASLLLHGMQTAARQGSSFHLEGLVGLTCSWSGFFSLQDAAVGQWELLECVRAKLRSSKSGASGEPPLAGDVPTDKHFCSQLYLVPLPKGIERPLDSFVNPETVAKMSTLNISNLARMSRESLAALLASPAASTLAIVDVRDSGTATTPMIKSTLPV